MNSKKNKTNLKNSKSKTKSNSKIKSNSKTKSKHTIKIDKYNDEINEIHKVPKIEGKFKYMFAINSNSIKKLHNEIYTLYSTSSEKNLVTPAKIHQIILNLFVNEYYPLVSKNIKEDKHTMSIIMGGVAFNMNIPPKMKFLSLPTDDIDLKIYTTEINYLDKKPYKVAKVLSVFKYIVIIICMFLKQVIPDLIEFSKNIFQSEDKSHSKSKKSNLSNKSNLTKKSNLKSNKAQKSNLTKKSNLKSNKAQKNNKSRKNAFTHDGFKLINNNHRKFGFFKSGKVNLLIKKNEVKSESFDLINLSYPETFNLIMNKIDDPDILITNKIKYSIDYQNTKKFLNQSITFSDSKIIYPNIDYLSFYSYYFMNSMNNVNKIHNIHKMNNPYKIENIVKQNILVSDVINYKNCKNNCHYITVKTLLLDCCLMLSYSELLNNEDVVNGKIFVKIKSIFKYYKYIIKFIRLHIIKKFYNGTLKKEFFDTAKELQKYILTNIRKKTEPMPEGHQLNIVYKNILNDFHQSFFKTKTLLSNFKELHEIVENYEYNLKFINKSRDLFKDLVKNIDLDNANNEDNKDNKLIELSSIKLAQKEISNDASKSKLNDDSFTTHNNNNNNNIIGGSETIGKKTIGHKTIAIKHRSGSILNDKYQFEDLELDNNLKYIPEDKSYSSKNEFNKIKYKLNKMITDEIKLLDKLSKSI